MRLPLGGRLTRPSLKLQLIFTKTAERLGACLVSLSAEMTWMGAGWIQFFQLLQGGAPSLYKFPRMSKKWLTAAACM